MAKNKEIKGLALIVAQYLANYEPAENPNDMGYTVVFLRDGLSGLANIYFATKGAPDMLKGTTSLSAKQQERWDKIRKEREARREAYLKAVRDNNRESLKNAYTQWKDNLEAKRKEEELELKRNKDARDEAKANYEVEKAKLDADLLEKKIDKATYDAEIAKIKMEVAGELEQAKINKYNRTGSGGGAKGEYKAKDRNGKIHYFRSAKAAEYFAKQEGTWVEGTTQSTGDRQNSTTTRRGGYPGVSQNKVKVDY